jgi:putative ABC transport system substrate-binding protein
VNNRRQLIIAVGAGAFTAPFASFAQQQTGKTYRIGYLGGGWQTTIAKQFEALREELRARGYVEGKNLIIEHRWAEGKYDRFPGLAAELINLKVDVLLTTGTPGSQALKQATTTIPIVVASIGDIVGSGIVTNLARPGGNITGSSYFSLELYAKRLELLRDGFPQVRKVAIVLNPENPSADPIFLASQKAAKTLKLEVRRFDIRSAQDFKSVFAEIAKYRADAAVIHQDALLISHAKLFADLAIKGRLLSIGFPEYADFGGLMGYGIDQIDQYRRAAAFVDQILKGAKPGDIPIEQASKFELIANRKTAKLIGVQFPDLILQRVDRVID